jgi:Tfp pilus assembly protein PilF
MCAVMFEFVLTSTASHLTYRLSDANNRRMTTLRLFLRSGQPKASLIPAAVVLICYLPALSASLVWDDLAFLRDTAVYRDPDLWLSAIFAPFVIAESYLRPLPLFTFAIQTQTTGLSPLPLHLVNIAIHAFNATLLTHYIFRLRPRSIAAAVAGGLLYGLHPSLIESAVFVSSRFDLLVTTFCLIAVSTTRWDISEDRKTVVIALSFLAAALSKEMAVTLPAILLVLQYAPGDPLIQSVRTNLTKYRLRYVSLLAVGIGYLVFRWSSLGTLTGYVLTREAGWVESLLLVVRSIGEYLLLIVFPFGSLSPLHSAETPLQFLSFPILMSAAGLVVVFVLIRRLNDDTRRHATAGLIALIQVINIFPISLSDSYVAERFLTLPLALIVVAAATTLPIDFSPRKHLKSTIPITCFLLASVVCIQMTLPRWASRAAFWEWGLEVAPGSETVLTNLSRLWSEEGNFEDALEAARKAKEINPESHTAWNNTGMAQMGIGNHIDALDAFRQAVHRDASVVIYWSNLAMAFSASGQNQEAVRILTEEALPRDRHHPLANLNASAAYLNTGRPDLAAEFHQKAGRYLESPNATYTAIATEIENPVRWQQLGAALVESGDWSAARSAVNRAANLGASEVDIAKLRDAISAGSEE